MASIISALTSGAGGISMTGDASGILNLNSNGTNVVAVTATGATVTGTLAATGAVSGTTGTFTGVSTFPAGTALLPAITTTGDTNTGLWFPAADTVAASTGGTERMRIDSSGVLCVGTTGLGNNGTAISASGSNRVVRILGTTESEGALLVEKSSATTTTSQVYIQFTVNSQVTACGQINANGASSAAFGSFSDIRLKENIVDLPSQLDNIMALRPVEFDYIESEGGGHQIGFIAQEVQQVYPDLIGEREGGMLTLTDLNKNDARLIKAIQEQQTIINDLKSRIETLEVA